jgi:hypothetical protein
MIFVNDEKDERNENNIINFNNKFSKYTTNYTLLVISHIPYKEQNHKFTYKDNIHFLELHTPSTSDGVRFNDDDNNYLDNILKSYNFNVF